jgi:antitoxin component YwqK of YwqJK toxin-antitoxin module
MKAQKFVFITTIGLFLGSSCTPSEKQEEQKANVPFQSFEIRNNDTINRIDSLGRKHGRWEVYRNSPDPGSPGDVANVKLEVGHYVDGKKEGEWTYYFPDGKLKEKVIYKNDVMVKE